MTLSWPLLSWCRMSPARMKVTVSKPRCGWGPKGSPLVVRPIYLGPVVVEKQEGVDVLDGLGGQSPVSGEVGDGGAHGPVLLLDGSHSWGLRVAEG
jgi:hypothetical protein